MSQGLIRLGAAPYENPEWCNWWGATQFVSLFGSNVCTPKTSEQLRAEQVKDLEYVCRNAADPQACVTGALIKSDMDVRDATKTEAERTGTMPALLDCEQRAASESPFLSSVFGPGAACALTKVPGHTYLWAGAALVLFIAFKRSRP